ncbi:phage holin family protein [Trichocoleus sp. ST-U2]|nr:phage holin family protein [Coleofasciculus sp. FACHB-SPT9]
MSRFSNAYLLLAHFLDSCKRSILLSFGLFLFVLNAVIFGLAAWLVTGFRLRWGFWSALLGSLALSIVNSVLFHLLASLRL